MYPYKPTFTHRTYRMFVVQTIQLKTTCKGAIYTACKTNPKGEIHIVPFYEIYLMVKDHMIQLSDKIQSLCRIQLSNFSFFCQNKYKLAVLQIQTTGAVIQIVHIGNNMMFDSSASICEVSRFLIQMCHALSSQKILETFLYQVIANFHSCVNYTDPRYC